MAKPLKIILSAIAAVVLLLIVTAGILPFIINPNDFKPEIIAAVKDKTGRELALDGELKLSLFPWTGISTEKIALSNAPEFQERPFATIEQSNIGVRLLPLLSRKVEISHIVLKGLVVNLARNKQGVTNWDDLTASDLNTLPPAAAAVADKPDVQPVPERTVFSIGGITINNAHINWDDLKNEKHFEITDLNLSADKFAFAEPANITASMSALKSGSTSSHAIKLNTELTVNEKLDAFALHHSDLQVTSSIEAAPGQSLTTALAIADAALDLNQQTAKIYGLQLKSGDMALAAAEMTGTAIKDKPSVQGTVTVAPFSPAKVMQQLAIPLPSMQDANALSKMAANVDLAVTSDSADLQNLALTLDDTRITGAINIKSFSDSIIGFNLNIDALDADRYLSPRNKASKPIASPAVLLAAGLSALPVETLRKLNADGTVSVDKLKVNDLAMQDVRINLSSKNGMFTTQQTVKQFYQGSYSGDLHMDTHGDKPTLAVNEKIDQVQIEPLLKDYRGEASISGLVNASAQLQGQGHKTKELKTTLNGQLNFLFKDGVVKGFNLQKIIDEGKALIKGSALPSDNKNDQTLFSEMTGTATIANGLIQNNDLVAKSSKLRVDGKGNVNLISEAIDYKIDAKLLDAKAAATEPEQVKGAVAINVAGTLDKPLYTIDVASLLTDKNKAKVEKLINKIDKKLGSGVGDLLKNILK